MNTGICKSLLLGLAVVLTGCSESDALGFLQDGIVPGIAKTAKPFAQVGMAQGALTLVPPEGFCIDPKSVTQNFAIMARCDVLGDRSSAQDAPLGVVTISLARSAGTGAVSASTLSGGVADGRVLAQETLGGVTYLHMEADAPSDGLSDIHWRAVDQIKGYDVALALYAPDGSAALGGDGPRILRSLLERTKSASVAKDVATHTLRPKAKPKKLF